MTTRIIYHSKDFDGKASACLCIHGITPREYLLHPYDYGDVIPNYVQWSPEDSVYMLDVSFPKTLMEILRDRFRKFIWVDHHKSSIEECDCLEIAGLRRIGVGACALVWEYFFGVYDRIPLGLELLSKYDVWDKTDGNWETYTLPYQYGLRVSGVGPDPSTPEGIDFCRPIGGGLFNPRNVERMIVLGETAIAALRDHFSYEARHYGYVRDFHGYRAFCINAPNISSMRLDGHFNPEIHDLMLIWCLAPVGAVVKIKVSLYSTKPGVDVSVLAQKYSGGGHFGAAGFVLGLDRLGEVSPIG